MKHLAHTHQADKTYMDNSILHSASKQRGDYYHSDDETGLLGVPFLTHPKRCTFGYGRGEDSFRKLLVNFSYDKRDKINF